VKRLILFDIDGTLIDSAGAGKRAFERALQNITGMEDGFRGISYAGKTDLQILREGLEKLGIEHSDGLPDQFVARYIEHLKVELSRAEGSVKPGVKELLERIETEEIFFTGLLTGNLHQGARIKLRAFGLDHFFPLGAFGSDEEDRNRLLPVAVRRLSEMHGIMVTYQDSVVIGDTPRDIECAQVHGARCIAVATGPYSVQDLESAGADLVLPDLRGTEEIVDWIKKPTES
jgi:phosphoglycolate phosphatase-like HAD superfamily hydrolase